MRPEKSYHLLPHPPFHFSLPVLQLLSLLLLHLFSPPSVFLCLYSPVPASTLPQTLATKFVPRRSLCPPCQQVSLMPLQSSRCSSSGRLIFLKSLPSTSCLSIVLLSLHWTSWPFPSWLSLVPCPRRRVYRQPWPWHREHRKLHNYKKELVKKRTI